MKRYLQLALIALVAAVSLTSCDMNFYGGTPTAYGQLDNYYVINDYYNQYYYDNSASKLVITDPYEFRQVFGQASLDNRYGVPTDVDFRREFVIAVILPVTNQYTEIEPVSVNREGDRLYFTYQVFRGAMQSYYTQPFTAVVVDRRDMVEIIFQQVNANQSLYRGSDQRIGGTYYNYSAGYYNGGYYYNTYRYNAPTPPPPSDWRNYSRTYNYDTWRNNGYYNNYNNYNNNNHNYNNTPQGRRPTGTGGNYNNSDNRNNNTGTSGNRPNTDYNSNHNTGTSGSGSTSTGGRRPSGNVSNGSSSGSGSSSHSGSDSRYNTPSSSSSSSTGSSGGYNNRRPTPTTSGSTSTSTSTNSGERHNAPSSGTSSSGSGSSNNSNSGNNSHRR